MAYVTCLTTYEHSAIAIVTWLPQAPWQQPKGINPCWQIRPVKFKIDTPWLDDS